MSCFLFFIVFFQTYKAICYLQANLTVGLSDLTRQSVYIYLLLTYLLGIYIMLSYYDDKQRRTSSGSWLFDDLCCFCHNVFFDVFSCRTNTLIYDAVLLHDNVQRTRSLSNAISNAFQDITIQIYLDDLDI